MQSRTIYTFVLLAIIQTCIFADPVAQTFSDTQQFIDLSTYNFYLGRNAIYASLFTARLGKQVSLYLFQNNVKQYSIHVYDGDTDQAQEINIQGKIPQNIDYVEYPEAIVSSSGKMYVVVTADNTDPKARVDFQAMATDISQPAGCGKFALCIRTTMLQYSNYCLIVPITKAITNLRASDKYLVFKPTADIAFTHYWSFQSGYVQAPVVGLYTRDSLMTVDYLQNEYPTFIGQVEQSFIIRRYPPVTAVQITFVNLLGTGSLTVSTYMNNNLTAQPINYTPANFHGPFNIT